MRPPFPNGETIQIRRRRPVGYDTFGVQQYADELETYQGAAVWSQTAREVDDMNGERSDETLRIAVDADLDIDHIDAVVWRGRTYEMAGEPSWYGRSPLTGNRGPLLLNLTRITG